jgi:anthranilate phosphoribosyltransferase
VLDGVAGPYRDIVIFNAAAALVGGGHASTLQEAASRANDSIGSGKAMAALDALVEITNSKSGSA